MKYEFEKLGELLEELSPYMRSFFGSHLRHQRGVDASVKAGVRKPIPMTIAKINPSDFIQYKVCF